MNNVLIIGATSAIATAVARIYAKRGDSLYLLARDESRLLKITDDLRVRGASEVYSARFDAQEFSSHESVLDRVFSLMKQVDVVILAHGTLPDQEACQSSVEVTLREIEVNALSSVSVLTHLANSLEKQGSGTLAAITSVAGDRGRKSNYVYGSAKAMVSVFLAGLRHRLFGKGVNVLDVRPGFVDTPMTKAFDKGPLWAQPESVAEGMVAAIDRGKAVVYLPFFWAWIMRIVRNLPSFLFLRTSL
ncbi:SDR family oxidoreductase [Microbulbifer sp. YPW1]|uniref:SDR family oxidoreductase n=1 Tax=Microbulbifer sp. YPW1 TaxID=2745199 RepID=UPI00159B567C|nr:SDR family oxidoreductase [Microbulbifer sp. YPW1]QKX15653.1 SDR family oxidoreductase [Microbulbifer sp. YPW1]